MMLQKFHPLMNPAGFDSFLSRAIVLLARTDFKDSVLKAIQDACRFLAYQTRAYKEISQIFFKLYGMFNNGRKVMRIGRFLNEYPKLKATISAKNPNLMEQISKFLISFGLIGSSISETFSVLAVNGLVPGPVLKVLKKMATFLLIAFTGMILLDVTFLMRLLKQRKELVAPTMPSSELTAEDHAKHTAYVNQRAKLQSDIYMKYMSILKSAGDAISISNLLGIPKQVIGRPLTDGFMGMTGFYSSIFIAYQQSLI